MSAVKKIERSRADQRGWDVPFVGDDEALVAGLRARNSAAIASLNDRYGGHALRVLARILGDDDELEDLHHDVLVRAIRSAKQVEDASSLKAWISIVAVNVARSALKKRALRRWLTFLPWNEVPDVEAPSTDEETLALRRTYAILERLAPSERIVFALRIIEGMELAEVAEASNLSLATVKRRLTRAQAKFTTLARRDPILAAWLEGGSRWGDR
jgi:RNA polymerase sigma-70 factor (ECF subfamily)